MTTTTKTAGKKRKKMVSLKALRDKAWTAWSRKIRKDASDWREYARCYTCDAYKPYKELQAGHFLHSVLDYDPRNIHPQCTKCNHFQNGKLAVYATRLVKEYGPYILRDLEIESGHRGNKYSRAELEEIIKNCK
jgi:hypothetical protein